MFGGFWVRPIEHCLDRYVFFYLLEFPPSGVPFNDTTNFRFQIMEQGELILGDYLLGWQVGNEPDFYPGVSFLSCIQSS